MVVHAQIGWCTNLWFGLLRLAALEAAITKVLKESTFVQILDDAKAIGTEKFPLLLVALPRKLFFALACHG